MLDPQTPQTHGIETPASSKNMRLLLAALVLAYALLFAWITLTRYAAFESRALDMGNLNQATWNTAHGNWFHQTNQPGSTNRLSLHVEPILLPISLLYWLHDGPETLLLLQALIVALGAVPVFALARKQQLPDGLALLLATAWLLMPAMQSANWLEFHPVTLAPTFFMAAFYFLVSRRAGWYALFALLAAACKEEMGLLVVMMGIYALIFLRMRWTGILSIVLGGGWSLFAVLWVQRQFGDNIHWGRYAWMGETPGEMLRTLLTRLDLVILQLQRARAGDYLFRLLLPVGFLALLAPEVLLLALPSLAINLLADFAPMHEVTGLIYAAPIAPFVMLATVMGMGRLWRWTRRDASDRSLHLTMWVATAALVVGMVLAQWQDGYLPGMPNYRHYVVSDHDRAAANVLAQLAPSDRLSAQDKLNPHSSGRTTSYIFPDDTGIESTGTLTYTLDDPERPATAANAWLIDATGPAWPLHPNDVHARVEELLAQGAKVVAGDDGYLLLRTQEAIDAATGAATTETGTTGAGTTFPDSFYRAWRNPDTTPDYSSGARFGDALALLGYTLLDDANGDTTLQMYWRATTPIDEDFHWLIQYVDAEGKIVFDSLYYQPAAALWYPVSDWALDETVLVSALPWTISGDQIDIVLGVASASDPSVRLSIREAAPEMMLLEYDTTLHLGTFTRTQGIWGSTWRRTSSESMPALLNVIFGDQIALAAADVLPYAQGDDVLQVRLAWRLLGEAPQTWNLVLQLLDSTGNRKAQMDAQTHVGTVETALAGLAPGASVSGVYTVSLPQPLAPGVYTVVVGVHDWNTGTPVAVEGAETLLDQFVSLGTFSVESGQ